MDIFLVVIKDLHINFQLQTTNTITWDSLRSRLRPSPRIYRFNFRFLEWFVNRIKRVQCYDDIGSSKLRTKESLQRFLTSFGNPENHIPMLTDSIVFSFEAIHDSLSFFCKFTLAFNDFTHGNVGWSNIKLPVFFRGNKMS